MGSDEAVLLCGSCVDVEIATSTSDTALLEDILPDGFLGGLPADLNGEPVCPKENHADSHRDDDSGVIEDG